MRSASQKFFRDNLLIGLKKSPALYVRCWRDSKQLALPADRYTSHTTCNKAIHV